MPTSPQAAIFRDGQLVHLMQRSDFLGHNPEEIAETLSHAYQRTVAVS
jgi:putative YphP/YqiW family bacilliredoxin